MQRVTRATRNGESADTAVDGTKRNPTLRDRANVLADWADQMPLFRVYIFGGGVRGDARPVSDLDVAIEFDGNVPDVVMDNWDRDNARDFFDLKEKFGVKLSLHAARDDRFSRTKLHMRCIIARRRR